MIVRIRFKGTTDSHYTHDAEYVVLGFAVDSGVAKAVVVDDNGRPEATGDLNNIATWELVSAKSLGEVQVYP